MTGWLRIAKICPGCALFLAMLSHSLELRAEPVAEACPDRAAVLRALRALSVRGAHDAPAVTDDRLDLSTEDAGDAYRVSVNGRTRSYTDPRRDCAERAQVAAVFAALVLSSPNAVDSATEPEPEPEPATPPRTSPPARLVLPRLALPPAPRSRPWWFDAGAAVALAPGVAGPPVEPGVELGLAYVWSDFGAVVGVRLPAVPALMSVGDAKAHVLRYPLDLGARWVVRAPPFAGAFDAGALVSLLRVRQTDSDRNTQSRVEAGVRLATRWQLAKGAVSPYFELFSEVIPVRYDLALEPTGVLAKTPAVWVGAALGVSAHFD